MILWCLKLLREIFVEEGLLENARIDQYLDLSFHRFRPLGRKSLSKKSRRCRIKSTARTVNYAPPKRSPFRSGNFYATSNVNIESSRKRCVTLRRATGILMWMHGRKVSGWTSNIRTMIKNAAGTSYRKRLSWMTPSNNLKVWAPKKRLKMLVIEKFAVIALSSSQNKTSSTKTFAMKIRPSEKVNGKVKIHSIFQSISFQITTRCCIGHFSRIYFSESWWEGRGKNDTAYKESSLWREEKVGGHSPAEPECRRVEAESDRFRHHSPFVPGKIAQPNARDEY